MNEYVLRGFCQKCEWPIALEDGMIKGLHEVLDSDTGLSTNPIKCNDHKMEPVWFLSAKQMETIEYSNEFEKYCRNRSEASEPWRLIYSLKELLIENSFLVSKILKDAGEKSKEENK